MTKARKVFISYSWANSNHEDWVMSLAERLVADGVDVIIDKWNLKEGQDKYNFMETMVKSIDIQKVLIVLDKKYKEKAENRKGGVGTETQIISPKIYNDVSQDKFVPIISEKDEDGNPYIPTYLEGRIYIDLSENDRFEEGYETLLRNIYERPAYNKPKLGKAPDYLFEESSMTHKTSSIIRSFDNQMTKNPERIDGIFREFLDHFYDDLTGYTVSIENRSDIIAYGKVIHDKIVSYTPMRNDYISFIDKILKSEAKFDIEILIKFFERLPLLKAPQDDRSSWSSDEFINFKFYIHEIFLYTIAVGLKNEKYKFIEEILYSSYFFKDRYYPKVEPKRFVELSNYVDIFDQYYNQAYSKNYISPMADVIIKRIPENMGKNNIIDADLLCHYVSVLEGLNWFPITYIYKLRASSDLFDRLISLRHFEKVKCLFNVQTIEELQGKLNQIRENETNSNNIGYVNSFHRIPPIYNIVDIEKIGTTR